MTNYTLKWLRSDGGVEYYPAFGIRTVPSENVAVGFGIMAPVARVEFDHGGDTTGSIDQGTVWIMNDAGKTIDTIHISDRRPVAA